MVIALRFSTQGSGFYPCLSTEHLIPCAFGRGSDMHVAEQAWPQVCGHVAVRCQWGHGSSPAGPPSPTGWHCVPKSGRRCMRLTPCTTAPLNVEFGTCSNVRLGVVAATCSLFDLRGRVSSLGLLYNWDLSCWSVHARGWDVSRAQPGSGDAVVSVM